MFRHERPQKGRYRQFQQFGVEAFGMVGPDIDAEVIQLSAMLWQDLQLEELPYLRDKQHRCQRKIESAMPPP